MKRRSTAWLARLPPSRSSTSAARCSASPRCFPRAPRDAAWRKRLAAPAPRPRPPERGFARRVSFVLGGLSAGHVSFPGPVVVIAAVRWALQGAHGIRAVDELNVAGRIDLDDRSVAPVDPAPYEGRSAFEVAERLAVRQCVAGAFHHGREAASVVREVQICGSAC